MRRKALPDSGPTARSPNGHRATATGRHPWTPVFDGSIVWGHRSSQELRCGRRDITEVSQARQMDRPSNLSGRSGTKHIDSTMTSGVDSATICMSVIDDEVNRTQRSGPTSGIAARSTREAGSMIDPYTAMKSIEYNQQELARLRGKRNWVTLFKK